VVGGGVIVVVVGAEVLVVVELVDVVVDLHTICPAWQSSRTPFAQSVRSLPLSVPHLSSICARHAGRLHGGGVSGFASRVDAAIKKHTATTRTLLWTASRIVVPPLGRSAIREMSAAAISRSRDAANNPNC
jgi:hypothetical protein